MHRSHTLHVQWILIRAGCMLVGLLLASVLYTGPARAQDRIGTVIGITGKATLFRDGGRQAVGTGTTVSTDDRILTGSQARVEIDFGGDSRTVLGSGTAAVISHFNVEPDGGRTGLIELLSGILRMALRPGPDTTVEVTTRTAIASVRSTEWIVEAKPGTTGVLTLSGTVVVTSRADGTRVTLGPGEGSDVAGDGSPTAAKRWGAARVEAAIERTRAP